MFASFLATLSEVAVCLVIEATLHVCDPKASFFLLGAQPEALVCVTS